jgi:Uma2 family endonuclease
MARGGFFLSQLPSLPTDLGMVLILPRGSMSQSTPQPSVALPPRADELPYDDGVPMESARHRNQMVLLIDSLEASYRVREDFYVGGNMFLYFSQTQAKNNDFRGPDVFVVLGAEPERQRSRKSWVVWEEGGKTPDVIIELLSESTAAVDRGDKMRIYARALKVAEYFLFDPDSLELEGYTLDPAHGVYVRKVANEKGWLRCEQLGLWLGITRGYHDDKSDWLRWIDGRGEALEMPGEAWRARADEEKARADEEKVRADEEKARADEEKARADALARELAELRERAGR